LSNYTDSMAWLLKYRNGLLPKWLEELKSMLLDGLGEDATYSLLQLFILRGLREGEKGLVGESI